MFYEELYPELGKLFYYIAATDGKVQPSEKESLQQLILRTWKPLEGSTDKFGTDQSNLITFAFDYEKVEAGTENALESPPETIIAQSPFHSAGLKKAIGGYAINACIVIGSAVFLPYFGEHIALQTGLNNSFFGTLFLAAVTSLPELVVLLAALRLGALRYGCR